MAPESPGNLVVLDIVDHESGSCRYAVDRWDPSSAEGSSLFVSWYALECIDQWVPAAGGVVCVTSPPGYTRRSYSARPRVTADPSRLHWADVALGVGLMLVVLLPTDTIFAGPVNRSQWPQEAKDFNERMAIFWHLPTLNGQTTRVAVEWRVEPLAGRSLHHECGRLNLQLGGERFPEPPGPTQIQAEWAQHARPPLHEPPEWHDYDEFPM